LAEVFLAQAKFEDARQQLEEAIKVQADSAETYELLARVYIGLGDMEAANKARNRAKFLLLRKTQAPKNIHKN